MKILVLPGDGIGPEITRATLEVLRAADAALSLGLEFETREIGLAALATHGTTLPPEVLSRIPEVDGVILGPVSHYEYPPRERGGINPSSELRVRFELYANIRPCRSRQAFSILRKPMDLVIVRENTESLYSGIEHEVVPGVIESLNGGFVVMKLDTRNTQPQPEAPIRRIGLRKLIVCRGSAFPILRTKKFVSLLGGVFSFDSCRTDG